MYIFLTRPIGELFRSVDRNGNPLLPLILVFDVFQAGKNAEEG